VWPRSHLSPNEACPALAGGDFQPSKHNQLHADHLHPSNRSVQPRGRYRTTSQQQREVHSPVTVKSVQHASHSGAISSSPTSPNIQMVTKSPTLYSSPPTVCYVTNYYGLGLDCPPKPYVEGWPRHGTILGAGGTFGRWGLIGESEVIGGVPLEGILEPRPFLSLFASQLP
jgi:hypothetical protein